MFTGIVQGMGTLSWLKASSQFLQIGISFPEHLLYALQIGASVSVDGVCLTVVRQTDNIVYFDIVAQTLKHTTLKHLELGQLLNLERALKVGDELGGHQLSGHVSGTARVSQVDTIDQTQRKLYFNYEEAWEDYLFPKGFIAINGVSLTLVEADAKHFSVHLIPETLRTTNLSKLCKESLVNIETDYQTQVIVQTVKKYLAADQ